MVVGILQFELLIHDAASLKEKRRVVRSVKDRLQRTFSVAIAEVGNLDVLNSAVLGLAVVGNEGRHVAEVLDHVVESLRTLTDAELAGATREVLHGRAGEFGGTPADDESSLAGELIERAEDAERESEDRA